jgi:hypothetical protein
MWLLVLCLHVISGTFIPANSVEKHFFNGRKRNETGKNIPEFVHLKLLD